MVGQDVIRYSEAFKLQVIQECESGRFASLEEARRAYDIRGTSTVQKWLKKYGKQHLLGRVVTVATVAERNELQRLRAANKELERAVVGLTLVNQFNQGLLHVACERLGTTEEELKKKAGSQPLPGAKM